MYAAEDDPYCYPGTDVLKNIPGIRDQAALEAFEAVSTSQRSDEALPTGRFSISHYRAIRFLKAMVASFHGGERMLADEIRALVT